MFKKLFSFLIVLSMTLVLFTGVQISVSAEENADNKCGYNVTYTLTKNGGTVTVNGEEKDAYTLTINGTGDMYDYNIPNNCPPWYDSRSTITSGVISNGVTSITSIGSYAFYYCKNLKTVTIPESVTSIGDHAFYHCESLETVTIPESVTSIGAAAFFECSSLTSVTIPENVTSIGASTFYKCSSLTSVTIPESVTSIGITAFADCSKLETVFYPDTCSEIHDDAFKNTTATQIKYNVNGGKLTITDIIPNGDPAPTSVTIGTMDGQTADTIIYESGLTVSGDIVSPTTTKIEYTENDGKITISKIEVPNGGKAEIPATIGGKPVAEVAEDYQKFVDTTKHTTHTYENDVCTICGAAKPAVTEPTVTEPTVTEPTVTEPTGTDPAGADIELTPESVDKILTDEEKANGVKVITEISEDVSVGDKGKVYDLLGQNETAGIFLDISLYKKDGENLTEVTETNNEIAITVRIPDSIYTPERTYFAVRVHNNEAKKLVSVYDRENRLLTFYTDQFSTYAIAWTEPNAGTGSTVIPSNPSYPSYPSSPSVTTASPETTTVTATTAEEIIADGDYTGEDISAGAADDSDDGGITDMSVEVIALAIAAVIVAAVLIKKIVF